jgi:hypothetical protein
MFIKISHKEVIPKEETLTNRFLSASHLPSSKNETEKERGNALKKIRMQ